MQLCMIMLCHRNHDDIIKWKHFPCYWPFVWGIHRSPVNSLHKGQRPGALMFSLICTLINAWVNNRDAGDLRCHHAHYDVTVMITQRLTSLTADIIMFIGYISDAIKLGIKSASAKSYEIGNWSKEVSEKVKTHLTYGLTQWTPWWRHQMETFSA